MFINLSNHPSASWGHEQLLAARELGGGAIRDIKFPNVDPNLSGEEVAELAEQTLRQLPPSGKHEPITLMVMGDFSLTCAIIAQVSANTQTYGYHFSVVFATTERNTVEVIAPDGAITKTAVFRFVRFRAHV